MIDHKTYIAACALADESASAAERAMNLTHALKTAIANPLPAPALTEDAIVAALKADPEMAGRVIVGLADGLWAEDRTSLIDSARNACSSPPVSRGAYGALQSLAVALAAASYRP